MKKIFNIFAGISLITAGASSVVACGSKPPTPPKSKVQKLYDKLQGKTFKIEDNNFWGNEATYKQDLLADLEQVAHITSQEDKNLLHDANVKPLTQKNNQSVDVQSVDINIDGIKDPAIVKIKWELTEAQKPIYKFYTQYWPQETVKYDSNLLSLFYGGWDPTKKSPSWKEGDPLGWWKNDKGAIINNHLSWNDNFNNDIKKYLYTLVSGMQIPTSIQNMLHVVKPSTIKDNLYITKSYNIPIDHIYILSHGVKYNLGCYASYDSTKALPQMQSWNISYDTGYNLMEKEFTQTTWYIRKALLDHKTTSASDPTNTGLILDSLAASKYGTFSPGLTFSGNIKTNGTPGKINFSYNGIPGGTIKVVAL